MPRQAKLLYLIPDGWPTHRADVAVLFGKELPRHGISCDLVAQRGLNDGENAAAWPAGRALLCRRTGSRVRDQLRGFGHDCRMLWRAQGGEYAAIQVRDKVFAGVFALVRARWLRVPFFFWMSYPMSEASLAFARGQGLSLGLIRLAFVSIKGHLGRLVIYRWLLPRCDHVFLQSERMLADVAAHGIPRRRMTAVPMGVDVEAVARVPRDTNAMLPGLIGKRVIGYLGILDRGRRIDFLLEVLSIVRESVPNACLLLVGDASEPSDRRWLEAEARKYGVEEAVIWTGWVATHVAWTYLRDVDVAVSLFPRSELLDSASPTKVVEYLALGLPVVANDQPDQHQVLTQSGAGFSVTMHAGAFAAAILRILEDTGLRCRMKAAGPPYVAARRSYSLIGKRLAATYDRLLQKREDDRLMAR